MMERAVVMVVTTVWLQLLLMGISAGPAPATVPLDVPLRAFTPPSPLLKLTKAHYPVPRFTQSAGLDFNDGTAPGEVQYARHLQALSPSLSPADLARRVPASPVQHDLIAWMLDDLDVYVRERPDKTVPEEHWRESERSLRLLSDAADRLDRLTQRDVHYLVSVFATPGAGDVAQRRQLDVTGDDDGRRMAWQQIWPEHALLFTPFAVDHLKMALRFGTNCHYLGLLSHRNVVNVYGERLRTSRLLRHDLRQVLQSSGFVAKVDDWPRIHAEYRLWRAATFPHCPQLRTAADVVYYHLTHYRLGGLDPDSLFEMIADLDRLNLSVFAHDADPRGSWTLILREAIDLVLEFWRQHVPSSQRPVLLSHEKRLQLSRFEIADLD